MFKKLFITSTLAILSLIQISALAHVVVKPSDVKTSSFERFAVGVPVEKDIPTIGVRLIIPEGLNYVSPYVKPGWNIEIKKDNSEKPKITEINWTGGNIPVGQKDEFIFSAQVPATESSIKWKAYQTYSDGSIVNWDMEPVTEAKNSNSEEKNTPFSITKVTNSLNPKTSDTQSTVQNNNGILIYILVGLSLITSIGTGVFVRGIRK